MKIIHAYDSNGRWIPSDDKPIKPGDNGLYIIPKGFTEKPLPQPNWKPVFDGEKWVETITQVELESIKNQPVPLSFEEQLRLENQALKQQLEQTNADLAAFMDFVLGGM